MKRTGNAIHAALVTMLISGCAGDPTVEPVDPAEDLVGETSDALEESNALTPNALTPNALTPNALTPNALTPNALTPNALTPNSLLALVDPGESGDLSRKLVRYTVSCALTASQSFSFKWTAEGGTEQTETYWGSLGLAPGWASGPLDSAGRAWVSACLASRLNYYGVSVLLSARGGHSKLATVGLLESVTYTKREGAFWGDVFGSSPYLYACYHEPNVDHSRASMRKCAAGNLEADGSLGGCGIVTIVGACEDWCSPISGAGGHYASCGTPEGTTTDLVVTTYLQ